jgi:hypothetical protein
MTRRTLVVKIRGVTYDSAQQAAQALGVSVSTIYNAQARGPAALERVGLGKGRPVGASARGGKPSKAFTLGPYSFPSRRAASRALGMSDNYVSDVLRTGGPAARQLLLRRLMLMVPR